MTLESSAKNTVECTNIQHLYPDVHVFPHDVAQMLPADFSRFAFTPETDVNEPHLKNETSALIIQ